MLPANRTFESFAEPKSTSRSTQSSKATSVSLQSRKLTESSLQPRNSTRLPTHEKACTPANTHPLNQTSVSDDWARSTATSRVSPNHTSDSLARRSRPPSNPVAGERALGEPRAAGVGVLASGPGEQHPVVVAVDLEAGGTVAVGQWPQFRRELKIVHRCW